MNTISVTLVTGSTIVGDFDTDQYDPDPETGFKVLLETDGWAKADGVNFTSSSVVSFVLV